MSNFCPRCGNYLSFEETEDSLVDLCKCQLCGYEELIGLDVDESEDE